MVAIGIGTEIVLPVVDAPKGDKARLPSYASNENKERRQRKRKGNEASG